VIRALLRMVFCMVFWRTASEHPGAETGFPPAKMFRRPNSPAPMVPSNG
jgi:hypothetical protein